MSEKDLKAILAPNIQLIHQTNGETPFHAEGIETVASLFKKYIFDNTSHIAIKLINLKSEQDAIVLHLVVEEDKLDEHGKINRFLFNETTVFKFNKDKISSINSLVRRQESLKAKL